VLPDQDSFQITPALNFLRCSKDFQEADRFSRFHYVQAARSRHCRHPFQSALPKDFAPPLIQTPGCAWRARENLFRNWEKVFPGLEFTSYSARQMNFPRSGLS